MQKLNVAGIVIVCICSSFPVLEAFTLPTPNPAAQHLVTPPRNRLPVHQISDARALRKGGVLRLSGLLGLQTLRKKSTLRTSALSTDSFGQKNIKPSKSYMVFLLVLLNAIIFVVDKFSPIYLQGLYLNHRTPELFQFVTSAFCHANAQHLSSNMFPLLVFGKSVEEELGGVGLLLCYIACAVLSNLASVFFLPSYSLGLGASGVVFGLFIIAIGTRLSLRNFSWRSTVEAVVFGQYVWEKLKMEVAITASGGIAGINHAAHLGGAAAGLGVVIFMRAALALFDKAEASSSSKTL